MEIHVAIALICSGLFVGFINTLSGGATIISLSVLSWLGLPLSVANGTNRVAVLFQTLTSVSSFENNKLIDWKKSLRIAIPLVIGSIVGSFIVIKINEEIFRYCFIVIMASMVIFMFIKPSLWLKENAELLKKPIKKWYYLLFFVIGIYGGFIHVGLGYYLLAVIVLGLGHDLLHANAMKNLLVLLYIPFSLIVFIANDQVVWKYGLVHAIGNVIGAFIASRLAIKNGSKIIRIVMIFVFLFLIADLTNLINVKNFISFLLNK